MPSPHFWDLSEVALILHVCWVSVLPSGNNSWSSSPSPTQSMKRGWQCSWPLDQGGHVTQTWPWTPFFSGSCDAFFPLNLKLWGCEPGAAWCLSGRKLHKDTYIKSFLCFTFVQSCWAWVFCYLGHSALVCTLGFSTLSNDHNDLPFFILEVNHLFFFVCDSKFLYIILHLKLL